MNMIGIYESTFAGPTNTKGSRIRVKNLATGRSQYANYDYALDSAMNHWQAIRIVLERDEIRNYQTLEKPSKTGFLTVAFYPDHNSR
jgi:hypothetical protein